MERPFAGIGTLVLVGRESFTLAWGDGAKDLRRGVPPDLYRVRAASRQEPHEGELWTVRYSWTPGAELRVAAGEAAKPDLSGSLLFAGSAEFEDGLLQLGFALSGPKGSGVTLLRGDGERPPVRYRVLDSKGKVLAEGAMNWG